MDIWINIAYISLFFYIHAYFLYAQHLETNIISDKWKAYVAGDNEWLYYNNNEM